FLLGKFSPYIAISFVNAMVLWAVAVGPFGAPFRGGLFFFIACSFVFAACTAGIGLVVSLLASTQVSAIVFCLILTFVPVSVYSGLLMPVASLDAAGRIQAHLIPAMYYTDIVIGIFLKGAGVGVLWGRLAALLVYASALMAAGYFLFRKRRAA
ncbi:MAG: ABC transporter permease, partial [Nitrospiraceae bacterium]|nr:ABC transporter permease [Nitrospiraceae bacterium]